MWFCPVRWYSARYPVAETTRTSSLHCERLLLCTALSVRPASPIFCRTPYMGAPTAACFERVHRPYDWSAQTSPRTRDLLEAPPDTQTVSEDSALLCFSRGFSQLPIRSTENLTAEHLERHFCLHDGRMELMSIMLSRCDHLLKVSSRY